MKWFLPTAAGLRAWLDAITGDEKFLLVVGCGAISSLHLALKQINESTWLTVINVVVVSYLTGKAVENTVNANADARVKIAKTEALAASSPPNPMQATASALEQVAPDSPGVHP